MLPSIVTSNGASTLFLVLVFVVIPMGALGSTRRLRAIVELDHGLTDAERRALWTSTIFVQMVLYGLAWLAARSLGFEFFTAPRLDLRDWMAAGIAMVFCLGLLKVSNAIRSDEERKSLLVNQLVPRRHREWMLWGLVCLAAGVAEEAAYRGVTMEILQSGFGNPLVAALASSFAFALAHSAQGWKSGVVIFFMALIMHGLVALTGTLVLAMLVHALYDLAAGWLISRQVRVAR